MIPGLPEVAAWTAWSFVFMAAVEYLAHKYLMHRPRRWAYGVFHRHAVLHHHGRRNDTNIDLPPWYSLTLASPILLTLSVIGLWGPLAILAAVITVHALTWTALHRAIHGVGCRWVARLPLYRILSRHHEGHHRHPSRNYGAVFGPLIDALCGTRA